MADKDGPLWRVLGALDQSPKKSGSGYQAKCPAHEDQHASLSIGLGLDGRVLLKCFTGCSAEQIAASLGLSMADLFEKSSQGNPIHRFRLINPKGEVVAEHLREDVPGDKKMWWESHGRKGLNGTPLESLPLYRLPDVLNADPSQPVIVCEGEKAADALAEIGLLAVGTVTGANTAPSEESLAALAPHEVWLWPDNDELGRAHMQKVAQHLKRVRWIDWPSAPEKGDAADYVSQGGTPDGVPDLLVAVQATNMPTIKVVGGADLSRMRFAPVRWAIPGILPSGLTILAGRPKLGKSWLVLGWAIDIALGLRVLYKIDIEQGETLYLALEDNERRLQERQVRMLGDRIPTNTFQVSWQWPRMGEGGLEALEDWLEIHPRCRLVAIDTFKRFRPKELKFNRLYDLDYDAVAPLAEMAARRNIAVVLVFHTNKGEPTDPVDLVSGTLGLSGAADGVLVLKRERGQADASLFVTGRDVEEQDLALKWESDDPFGWTLLGQSADFRLSKERAAIVEVVRAMPGIGPTEIANATQKKSGAIRYLLFQMVRDSEIRNRDGKYYVLDTTPNTPNTPITPTNANGLTSVPRVRGVSAVSRVRGVRGVRGKDFPVCAGCGGELPQELIAEGLHPGCTLED